MRLECLRTYLIREGIDARHYSLPHLKELDSMILKKRNFHREYGERVLSYDYGALSVSPLPSSYCYSYESLQTTETPYFSLRSEGTSMEAVTVKEEDFPLTVRSPQKGDAIQMRYGRKSLHRFFIDRKIGWTERQKWPVVLNRENEIIFVPQIGCSTTHYSHNPNLFVIKY